MRYVSRTKDEKTSERDFIRIGKYRRLGSKRVIWIMILAILANACGRQDAADFFGVTWYSPSEAEGFEIVGTEGCESRVIRVKTAWQGDKNGQDGIRTSTSSGKELFIARNGESPPEGFGGQVLDGNAERIAVTSSSHIALLDLIGEVRRVKAVSGIRYISNAYIRGHRDSIADIGYEAGADFEALAAAKPDIVLLYGISSSNAMEDRLRILGIPYLYIGEYLETSPLGKAEWVVAIAELLGCREKGEEAYRKIASGYEELTSSVPENAGKPKVMLNSPYGDTWFMASPESAMVSLIRDAGGEYVFKDRPENDRTGRSSGQWKTPAIDFETAFILASKADVWLNVGQYRSLEQFLAEYPQFAAVKCVRDRQVYSCDRRSTEEGGSDFWESGTVRPDLVLEDLIRILHPGLHIHEGKGLVTDRADGESLHYYRRLDSY